MATLSVQPEIAHATEPHATCAHCGLDVSAGRIIEGEGDQFCCAGCEAVFVAIKGCGLDHFYSLKDDASEPGQRATTSSRRFQEFDDPVFRSRHCVDLAGGLRSISLALEGVHCRACVWLVEKLPLVCDGVHEVRLNLGRRIVHIVWNDESVALSAIARKLAAFGYVPHLVTNSCDERIRSAEDRRYLIRIAIAGALAGNVMVIAFALYGGMLHGIESQFLAFFQWVSLALTLVALAVPGRTFFASAAQAIRTRTAHMDIPIATGLTAGTIWSVVATIRGTGEVYYDCVTLLIFLLLVGRWIQVRQQRRSTDAVDLLFSMTPQHARRLDGDEIVELPVESLEIGHLIEVLAGESVPADGVVVKGTSQVETAWLTGEPHPVRVEVGSRVHSGFVNVESRIVVRVEATGASTRAGRLMQIVERCAHERAPIVRLADRIAGYFVITVLALATITCGAWWWVDSGLAVENAIALLIITCPCALGLATPLAIVASIGQAARRGILIKGGEAIESLSGQAGTVFLDKTGTITEGRMRLCAWHGPDELLPIVAAIESHSSHPVARALAVEGESSNSGPPEFADVRVANNGVSALADGRSIHVGSRAYVMNHSSQFDQALADATRNIVRCGWTPVFIAVDGDVTAIAGIGDSIRPDAANAVSSLARLGWRVEVLSGDDDQVVKAVGRAVGIRADRCRGELDPEAKHAIVADAVGRGSVIMVGDGVNDAAALAAATVGVAVHGGAEASLASADVYLSNDGLSALPALVLGANRTRFIIRRGLSISLAYNVVGCGLAVCGLINPIVAAILMPVSSLTVLTLAFRSRSFGGA